MTMQILLLEDHPLFRLGVRQLIAQHWPQVVFHEADTLQAALAIVAKQPVDVALLDLNLPDATGVESVTQLRRVAPDTRLLVLSLNTEAAYARRVLQLGASAYLTKSRAAEELVLALQRVLAGGRYITDTLAELLADLALDGQRVAAPHEALGSQEYRVLLRLALGHKVGDIAKLMHLSPKTVSTYRTRVLEKLGLTSNIELARYCQHHQLNGDADTAAM